MKRKNIVVCLLGITALGLGAKADAQSVIFNYSNSQIGNQSGFELGMEFTVNTAVTVTSLGTFDGNLNGIPAATQTQIYNSFLPTTASSDDPINIQVAIYTHNGTLVSPIANFNAAGALANQGTSAAYFQVGGSVFQSIKGLLLQPGLYDIVATGYTYQFASGNTSPATPPPSPSPTPTFNTLGGALTLTLTTTSAGFDGTQANGGYPLTAPPYTSTAPEAGGSPDFLAGTFQAITNGTPTVPDGGMTMTLLGFGLLGTETLRRKFKR